MIVVMWVLGVVFFFIYLGIIAPAWQEKREEKEERQKTHKDIKEKEMLLASKQDWWTCECGRINPRHIIKCACGKCKDLSASKTNEQACVEDQDKGTKTTNDDVAAVEVNEQPCAGNQNKEAKTKSDVMVAEEENLEDTWIYVTTIEINSGWEYKEIYKNKAGTKVKVVENKCSHWGYHDESEWDIEEYIISGDAAKRWL